MELINSKLVISKLPQRPKDANKGTFGKALIIAGSKNYPGAAILSGLACARVGAGLITLATTPEVYKVAVPKIPFATFLDFSEVPGSLEKYDSILIGPGLGQSVEVKELVNKLLNSQKLKEKKLVLDADVLNILSLINDWYKTFKEDAILTPHPGEMARLTGLSIEEIQNHRGEMAIKFSKLWNKTIVLKGAKTIIANSKGEFFKSEFSNPLLATAGTGDILAGIITGLLAQGLNQVDAAVVGVWIHGIAAQKLTEKFGDRGMTALDLVEKIPEVFKDLQSS